MLAVLASIDAALDLRLAREELQLLSSRGGTSGIGIHTYFVGGFLIDAGTMAAILYDYATHSELRDAVKTEFTRIQGLFGEYQTALAKAYPKPEIAEPK